MSKRIQRKKIEFPKLNLIPILDAVFIFIFFLLMSAKFINLREIGSDVPIVSESEPVDDKDPLNLTLAITSEQISIKTGLEGRTVLVVNKVKGSYEYEKLHSKIVELKKKNLKEESIIFEPKGKVKYNDLVQIMDHVRTIKKNQKPIYIRKNGKLKETRKLFGKIVFSNMQG